MNGSFETQCSDCAKPLWRHREALAVCRRCRKIRYRQRLHERRAEAQRLAGEPPRLCTCGARLPRRSAQQCSACARTARAEAARQQAEALRRRIQARSLASVEARFNAARARVRAEGRFRITEHTSLLGSSLGGLSGLA